VEDKQLNFGNVVVDALSAVARSGFEKSCSVLAAVRPFWQFPSIMEHIVGEPVGQKR
jgi:hypothetical protein